MQHLPKYQDSKSEPIQANDLNRLKGLKYEFKDKKMVDCWLIKFNF